ncbi:LacI family DNA-binding transcriptional regulator [Rhodoferax saidenbachensis]|uniref:LacI family gluconate utilization system Gnt-I transcriptional repressor n=1 Tax=Rhodoferax saidenbachensis TaxID=1484693 RepID=A0ABU1ZN11_9BURK|nr:LacI family DNA-binding transcriptional regulator [Rhodoferax saidenbachensis]MDR7306924.1 LacI family gluconate utilization system Gnt-I transcriptional repressor [Rhodoferax saidenbachensis]
MSNEGKPEPVTSPVRKSRASGRVTLDDVARSAGVSRITASRALRAERSVDKALVARVEVAALALGYVPDPAARALASARSNIVVVLIPLLSNHLFVDLLEAVHRTLHPAGYQILIGVTHYDAAEEEALLASYLAHRPAGILVTGTERTERSRALLTGSGVPCVHLMEISQDPALHCVGFSQADASRAMTEHLLSTGRRRIAFAAAQLDPRVLQRLDGYRQALQAAGLHDPALEWLRSEPSSLALGGELLARHLRDHPDVDAIFFCNDDLAQGGLLAALRLGIAVPQRVAIAGFNDLAGSDQMWPALTTIRTPRAEIGESAAAMLLQRMRGDMVAATCVDVGWELKVRQST